MREPYGSQISTTYGVNLNVNAKQVLFTGTGYGNDAAGAVGVDVRTDDPCPDGFDPALMAFCLITGQADIGQRQGDVENPFQANRGAYKAFRTLTLDGDLGSLAAEYSFDPIDEQGQRTARFDITGTVRVPKIVGIRPAYEMWVPAGPDRLRGHFTMAWVDEKGDHFKGEVDTVYELPGVRLSEPLYRRISFTLDSGPQHLRQDEKITVFSEDTDFVKAA